MGYTYKWQIRNNINWAFLERRARENSREIDKTWRHHPNHDNIVGLDMPIYEEDENGKAIGVIGYAFLGTVFEIMPSRKFYTPWAHSNVTLREADKDERFSKALEQVASEHDGMIISGEGNPCDLWYVKYFPLTLLPV
jgi:hypothetical protein